MTVAAHPGGEFEGCQFALSAQGSRRVEILEPQPRAVVRERDKLLRRAL